MASRREFERAVASEAALQDRIVVFGALLAKTTGLGGSLVIVGGSAISIYTAGEYVSEDIDLVGPRDRIVPVLKRWGFVQDARGERPYWARPDLGLAVDLTGRKRYSGHRPGVRTLDTPHGRVRVAAPEDLVVRRLILAKRDRKEEHLNEAALVLDQAREGIDLEYVESLARYERVGDLYRELVARLGRAGRETRSKQPTRRESHRRGFVG